MADKPQLPSGKGAVNKGQIDGNEPFGQPFELVDKGIAGMGSARGSDSEMTGFQADTSSYIVKKGTPYGEAAKFNFTPPGMDISDQANRDIRNMPLKRVVAQGYPGDGWEGARDITE